MDKFSRLLESQRLGFVVERVERCADVGGTAGPSTAQFAKCANCFAQDDEFVGV